MVLVIDGVTDGTRVLVMDGVSVIVDVCDGVEVREDVPAIVEGTISVDVFSNPGVLETLRIISNGVWGMVLVGVGVLASVGSTVAEPVGVDNRSPPSKKP